MLPLDAFEVIVIPEGILINPDPAILPIVSSPPSNERVLPDANEALVFPKVPLTVISPAVIADVPV